MVALHVGVGGTEKSVFDVSGATQLPRILLTLVYWNGRALPRLLIGMALQFIGAIMLALPAILGLLPDS